MREVVLSRDTRQQMSAQSPLTILLGARNRDGAAIPLALFLG